MYYVRKKEKSIQLLILTNLMEDVSNIDASILLPSKPIGENWVTPIHVSTCGRCDLEGCGCTISAIVTDCHKDECFSVSLIEPLFFEIQPFKRHFKLFVASSRVWDRETRRWMFCLIQAIWIPRSQFRACYLGWASLRIPMEFTELVIVHDF